MQSTRSDGIVAAIRTRLPPFALLVVGLTLTSVLVNAALGPDGASANGWFGYVLLIAASGSTALLGAAVTVDPRPLTARRLLAGAGLLWVLILAAAGVLGATEGWPWLQVGFLLGLAGIAAIGLLGLAATTGEVAPGVPLGDPLGRLGAVVTFSVAILVAVIAIALAAGLGLALWRAIGRADPSDRVPWGAFIAILVLPVLTFAVATLGTRRAAEGTFYQQAAANRRNSVLLLVCLVGVVAATGELIVASLTLDPLPAVWAAGVAGLVGLGAAFGADRFGARLILGTAGAKPADPTRDAMVLDVVRELSLAAGIPEPAVYVVEDGSQNAFATGRDPRDAAVAVTRGLVEGMDREELQGVIGHELGHIRNLDTRYALYVAVLVGLVAIVTDGFLRTIVEGWRRGAFIWTGGDDAKAAAAAFVTGIAVGLFLLVVAVVLRIAAPLFSSMVQAAVSREREFLADATSVEFTRNPHGLERALAAIAVDTDELDTANRGTQHLWFRNPVKAGSDRRAGILATHPTLSARIDRLRALEGLDPLDPAESQVTAAET